MFVYELLLFKILLAFLQSLFPFCEKHSFKSNLIQFYKGLLEHISLKLCIWYSTSREICNCHEDNSRLIADKRNLTLAQDEGSSILHTHNDPEAVLPPLNVPSS